MCIHLNYHYNHLWSLSLIGKNPNSKAIVLCLLFSFCIFFILSNGNNLSHFSFSAYFFMYLLPVVSQAHEWSTVRVTNTEGKWLQWNRDSPKGTDHLICSVFILPFIQTKPLRASARRQVLYPIIFRRVKKPKHTWWWPLQKLFPIPR